MNGITPTYTPEIRFPNLPNVPGINVSPEDAARWINRIARLPAIALTLILTPSTAGLGSDLRPWQFGSEDVVGIEAINQAASDLFMSADPFEMTGEEFYAWERTVEEWRQAEIQAVQAQAAELPTNGDDGFRVTRDLLTALAAACAYAACPVPVPNPAIGLYGGGAHLCTKGPTGDGLESHHMPANSISPLPQDMGPAIRMTPGDHARTGSWRSSNSARAFRADQAALMATGNISAAFMMDVRDLQSKGLASKYAASITQSRAYMTCLIAASGGVLH